MDIYAKIYRILTKIDRQEEPTDTEISLINSCVELNWSFRDYGRVPRSICCLKNLRMLNLSGMGLTALPKEICRLSNLTELVVKDNELSRLPKHFGELRKLQILDLSENCWIELPRQIRQLSALTYLNLSDCSFSELPGWLLEFNLEFCFKESGRGIILENTESPEIPIFHQRRESILKYFQRRSESGKIVRETKVIFLGDGTVGKTYTIDRINNDGKKLRPNHAPDQTKGISIVHKDFEYEHKPVTIHFWDFGGQQIMHSMHRCFLTNNTIYVIVLSGRAEDMERRLQYWMTSLNGFTQGSCPVIVLENCFDVQNIHSVNTTQARRQYKNIKEILSLNVKESSEEEFTSLISMILRLATTESLYGKEVAKLWADIKLKLESSQEPYLTERQFSALFPEGVNAEERYDILEWLNDLGVSFSYHRDQNRIILHGYVVLNPEWATNAIYAIITSRKFQDSCEQEFNGIVTLQQIQEVLKETEFVNQDENIPKAYGKLEIGYILQLMERFQISYKIPENMEYAEFIPSLCKKEEPKYIEQDMQRADLHFEIHYEYLPSNILHRFMISRYDELHRGGKWWYSGSVFDSDAYQCEALVLLETRVGNDVISIYIQQRSSGEAWRYLLKIRNQIEETSRQLNVRPLGSYIIYAEQGQTKSEKIDLEFVLKSLMFGWDPYRSPVFKKEIPLADILKNVTSPGVEKAVAKRDLLGVIISGCHSMQKRCSWLPKEENRRNDYLRDILCSSQIYVLDQTRSGWGHKESGEIDFLIQDNEFHDVAIMEALNLKSIDKQCLQDHIDKLMKDTRYNVNGLRELYLLVYADVTNFSGFCNRYYNFIKCQERYPYPMKDIISIEQETNNINVWKTSYTNDTDVYHICVKIPTRDSE